MSDYSLQESTAVLNNVSRIITHLLDLKNPYHPPNKGWKDLINNGITNLIEEDYSTLKPIFVNLAKLNPKQLLEFKKFVVNAMKIIRDLEKTITQNNLKMSQVDEQQQTKLQEENNKYESYIENLKTTLKHPDVYSGEFIQLIIKGKSVPKEVIQLIIKGESVPKELIQLIIKGESVPEKHYSGKVIQGISSGGERRRSIKTRKTKTRKTKKRSHKKRTLEKQSRKKRTLKRRTLKRRSLKRSTLKKHTIKKRQRKTRRSRK